jgi:outer membrane lipoprotein carrier protein
MLLVASLLLTAASPTPEQLLARVQTAYQKGDLTAAFEQTSVEAVRAKKRTERGRLWAKGDGRVRWTYEQPTVKDFVYDGKAAYLYEPENAQVTVFERFQDSPLWNAVRFLWGQGSGLLETFDVSACDNACPSPEAGEVLLRLVPKKPVAAVARVILGVDASTNLVRRSLVFDTLGNRTEYLFKDVKLGAKVEAKKFEFKMPKGVSVVYASSEGSK